MDIQQFLSLSTNEQGLTILLHLPPPEDTSLLEADSADLYTLAEKLYQLWGKMLLEPIDLPEDVQDKIEAWGRIVLSIGTYYDFVFAQLLERGYIEKQSSIPTPNFGTIVELIESSSAKEEGTDRTRAKILFISYTLFRISSVIYSKFKSVSHFAANFGKSTHQSLIGLLSTLEGYCCERDHISILAYRLLNSALVYLDKVYQAKELSTPWIWNKYHREGIFSAINLSELALLASRDPSLLEKYGDRQVEKRFEQQLTLVMQSLGFYVVPTRIGSKTVDLMCISTNPQEMFSFLLEAKTSGNNYSLPTKDSRAIQEYVVDVRKNLKSLPSLKFVLIVGPNPTRTITSKITELESSLSLPVRYCHAQVLADLRENLPGPMPTEVFLKLVLSSSSILDKDFGLSVIESYNQQQKAHIDFVEKMLSAANIKLGS